VKRRWCLFFVALVYVLDRGHSFCFDFSAEDKPIKTSRPSKVNPHRPFSLVLTTKPFDDSQFNEFKTFSFGSPVSWAIPVKLLQAYLLLSRDFRTFFLSSSKLKARTFKKEFGTSGSCPSVSLEIIGSKSLSMFSNFSFVFFTSFSRRSEIV